VLWLHSYPCQHPLNILCMVSGHAFTLVSIHSVLYVWSGALTQGSATAAHRQRPRPPACCCCCGRRGLPAQGGMNGVNPIKN
jgi:hypothetical protein